MSVRYSQLELIPRTILLRVYCAGVCGSDHIPSFQGDVEEEIMDLLEIGLGHGFEGGSLRLSSRRGLAC